MLRRALTVGAITLIFCISASVNTVFAQNTATDSGFAEVNRPSLSVCPVEAISQPFDPGKKVDCVTPLEEVVKLEQDHTLELEKQKEDKVKQAQSKAIPFTYFTAANIPSSSAADLNPDVIFNLINEFRAKVGLGPFQKDSKLCDLAASRAPEMPGEIANGKLHSGLYSRNLPYWVTENMKYGGNEADTVNWWLNSPIHHAAIVSNAQYACGTCVGNICDMLFTSYVPKNNSLASR